MLKDFPIFFDDVEVMQWSKWDEEFKVIENSYQTEAGTDQIDVVRFNKLSVSAQFRCHSEWLRILKSFSLMNSFTLKEYDPDIMDYGTRTVRMRDFKASPIEFSENVKDTHGVWDVTFKLEEF